MDVVCKQVCNLAPVAAIPVIQYSMSNNMYVRISTSKKGMYTSKTRKKRIRDDYEISFPFGFSSGLFVRHPVSLSHQARL